MGKTLILTEGQDDVLAIRNLMKLRLVNNQDVILEDHSKESGGYSNLLKTIEELQSRSDFIEVIKLIIIADADDVAIDNRFKEICSKLNPTLYTIPNVLGDLSMSDNSKKRTGIYLLPDNRSAGSLETLCLRAVTHPEKLECIEKHIECIKNKNLLETPLSALDKTRAHIYFATTTKPYAHIGGSFQKNVPSIDTLHSSFDQISNFIQHIINA